MGVITIVDIDYGHIFGPFPIATTAMDPTIAIGLLTQDSVHQGPVLEVIQTICDNENRNSSKPWRALCTTGIRITGHIQRISIILLWSFLLPEKIDKNAEKNHSIVESNWQTVLHKVVSGTPHHERYSVATNCVGRLNTKFIK